VANGITRKLVRHWHNWWWSAGGLLITWDLGSLSNVVTALANVRQEHCKLPAKPVKCCHCLADRRPSLLLPPSLPEASPACQEPTSGGSSQAGLAPEGEIGQWQLL